MSPKLKEQMTLGVMALIGASVLWAFVLIIFSLEI